MISNASEANKNRKFNLSKQIHRNKKIFKNGDPEPSIKFNILNTKEDR